MRIVLLSVGKPKNRSMEALHVEYAGRIRRFGVSYESRFVPEARLGADGAGAAMRREADRLRDALDEGAVVALDPRGTLITSETLAVDLERWARPRVTLVVGGPLGLDPAMRNEATFVWSLSPLTLPHELVRVIVAEQLFRALTIRRSVPYHK